MSLNGSISRRDFIKTTAVGGAAVAFAPIWAADRPLGGPRPNILFITTDQQHVRMMSCMGESHVSTPNLDALTAGGCRFDSAYCANPVCVPSRYSMMTGYMPHVFDGLETNAYPTMSDWVSTPTMGWIFKNAGYETAYGGKLHIEGYQSYKVDAEETFGFTHISSDQGAGLATACASFFNQTHDKPFLLWASFIQPHGICATPGVRPQNPESSWASLDTKFAPSERRGGDAPPPPTNFDPSANETDWMSIFRGGGEDGPWYDLGLNGIYGETASTWSAENWADYRWLYRRCVEEVDSHVGTVLNALKASGLEDNTIIVFTSDHGDHDGAHQLTMKRSFYEEAANIPLIVSWKNNIPAGTVNSNGLINNGVDLIPTLCDFAGIQPPAELKGKSFRMLAETGSDPFERDFVVAETVRGRMVRSKRYKYNLYYNNRNGLAEEELFDIRSDPTEMANLAEEGSMADTLALHRQYLTRWASTHQDSKAQSYLAAL